MRPRLLLALIATLLLAACATPGGYYSSNQGGYHGRPPQDGYARCHECGVVERIDRVYGERHASGGGAVLGGIIGGIVGNQVGSGSGRAAATAACSCARRAPKSTQGRPCAAIVIREAAEATAQS